MTRSSRGGSSYSFPGYLRRTAAPGRRWRHRWPAKSEGCFICQNWVMKCLVTFEHGDFDHPFIVGYLLNGVDTPPTHDPHRRLIHSVNGHEIEIYDPAISAGDKGHIPTQGRPWQRDPDSLTRVSRSVAWQQSISWPWPASTLNGRPVAPTPNPI